MIISTLLTLLVLLGIYVASHRLSGLQTLVVLLLLTAGGAVVVSPALAETLAEWFHVGRGTDLITYFAIVAGLFIAANYYFRFKRQEQMLVTTVRALALLKPVDESDL